MTSIASFLLIAFSDSPVAQTILPQFISVYGNFSIALPENPNLTRGVRNQEAPDKGAGMIYAWEFENVVYTVLYLDPLVATENLTPVEQAKNFEENNEKVRETIKKYDGKIIFERPLVLDGNPGMEIQATIGAGKMIARNFQVGKRSYSLQAVLRDLKDGRKALTVLESFDLIDSRANFLKKIAASTPKALPPIPIFRMRRSDLQTANLKGKVKAVVEESEDLTGDAVQQGRIFSAEYSYNERGFLTKEISYDTHGNPFQIAVYGFIEKALVAKFGIIRYPYDPPAAVPVTPRFLPYDLKFDYVFDEKGRVKESKYYRSTREISSRTLTTYTGNKTEAQNFNAEGELVSKHFQTFDENGNLIESIFHSLKPKVIEYKAVYKYDAFDEKGNWTRRILSEWRTANGKSSYEPVQTQYRTFVYYR